MSSTVCKAIAELLLAICTRPGSAPTCYLMVPTLMAKANHPISFHIAPGPYLHQLHLNRALHRDANCLLAAAAPRESIA
jgi:hypothetical protein